MGTYNINRDVTDQFYRYKMPRLIAKVEGKGNGIKTVIANMTEIGKALQRPATYPTKYFGCELGAQTQFDLKNERFIVNGAHDANKLQDLLDGFIKRFVLCPGCDNPETNLTVHSKKGVISQHCIACGHHCMVDMRHKLTTFMLKNPPDGPVDLSVSKRDKKNRRSGKEKDRKSNGTEGDGDRPESPENTTNTFRHTKRTHSHEDEDDSGGANDDEWFEDTSEDAVKARLEALTDAAKGLALNKDLEKTPQERFDIFYNFVKEKKEANDIAGSDKDILAEAERLDIRDKAPMVLAELLFTENMIKEIKEHRILFLRFTNENQKAQKYLLGAFEQIVGNIYNEKKAMPKVAVILKTLYDADIIDEDVLMDWDKKVSKKYVSKAISKEIHDLAAPFIKWLKEAEEESEEEESEEELEVVYSTTEKIGTQAVKEPQVEEDDDLDIDNI